MSIKASQTEYNGYKFRSRLEARWAVFFDKAGIKYVYEPEGFEVNFGEEIIRYLPDFYLPDFDIYCEVKPTLEKLLEDEYKLSCMIDFNGPMANGLLCLGNIPYLSEDDYIGFPTFILFSWYGKGVSSEQVTFSYKGIVYSNVLDIDFTGG